MKETKKSDGYIKGAGGNFKCQECGKLTRATNETLNIGNICPVCYEIGGLQNSLSDGAITVDDFMGQIEMIPGYTGKEIDSYTQTIIDDARHWEEENS